MEFRILGPLEVVDAERPVSLPGGRGRALLALLVLRAGQVISTERLIDELWGETPPPTAATALAGLVSNLRKRLEPGRGSREAPSVLETRPPGYVLTIDRGRVDANQFRRLIEEVKGASATEKAAKLRQALGLWRGPALADFAYEPFAQTAIAELEELRLGAIEERIDAALSLDRHSEVVGELQGLAAEHPLRERIRGQLMVALYRSGRQSEALEVYRDARRALVDGLGIEPGPALQRLEQAILRQDPSLDPQPAPPPQPVTVEPREVVPKAAAEPWLPQGRKTVTAVFVDLAESTSLGEHLDPEALRRIVGRYFDTAAGVLTHHGGTVEKFIGDAVVAVFGVPTAHEDDALRAVRAAVELHQALVALNEELERDWGIRLAARAGINTGEVVVGDPGMAQTMASGDAVNVAARLQQAAAEGEVLLGETTWRLVRDAALLEPVESLALKGKGKKVAAWKLLDLIPGAPAVARRLDTPIVGRGAELAQLRMAFDRTVRERRVYLFTVYGEAGIGKSRLAREFAEALEPEALILTGQCPAYGDGITFLPLRDIVLQVAGRTGRDALLEVLADQDDGESIADQVASAIGVAQEPGRADILFPAVRRFFEALTTTGPVVVILEDVHWAQPTFLDLIEYLARWTREPVFLLCLARPDLLEVSPEWGGGKRNASSLFLEPLGPEDTDKLISDRLAGRALPPELMVQIVQTAQGNPLFIEQMVAASEEEDELQVPPSVQALLAARLDRLGPAERHLIQCASVMGSDFSMEALQALLPEELRPFAGRHLQALERRELILPSRRATMGKETFGFRHVLIQLAAYRSTTREARATLHERFAEWLEGEAEERSPEFEEIIGYHLEQAYQQRRELGLLDEHARALAVRAGERLANAGDRAYGRPDVAAAENLLSRAKSLLPWDHQQRPRILRQLAEAYQMLGRHGEADALLAQMLEEAQRDGDPGLEQSVRLERARIRLVTGPDPTSLDAIRGEVERAVQVYATSEDDTGLAQAFYILGLVYHRSGGMREMEEAARRGLAHADRSGHAREQLATRVILSWAIVAGPTAVGDAIRLCEEIVHWRGTQNPLVMCQLASLWAMLGKFDHARGLIARARQLTVERMRVRRPLMFEARSSADVEILAGDLAAGEHELRAALEISLDMGELDQASQIAAGLSRILAMQGRFEETEKLAVQSMESAPAESVAAQALWRTAKARAMAGEDHREAERLAREAVQLIPTEMLNLRADLLADLAEIVLAAGDGTRGASVISEAVELYERKGNAVSATRARSLIT